MHIYRLTSKITYSRAVVIAASREEATRIHPAEYTAGLHIAPDRYGWKVSVYGGQPKAQTGWRPLRRSDEPAWPTSPDKVYADLIGYAAAGSIRGLVVCYERDLDPRNE